MKKLGIIIGAVFVIVVSPFVVQYGWNEIITTIVPVGKITVKELGNKLGYSTATISNWENLKAVPDMYNVEDVATYFNLPINVLVGEK